VTHASRSVRRRAARAGILLFAGLAILTWSVVSGTDPAARPRIAVFFLDGVPYRAAVEAAELGAFEGWSKPKAMLAPFPSMTNVSFTAMMLPLGGETVSGYEVRHFDASHNKMTSGVFNYDENRAGWRDVTHVQLRKKKNKAANYIKPRKTLWKVLQRMDDLVMETDEDLVFGHIGSTDVIGHWDSGDALAPVLVELSAWFSDLERRHEETRGRPLRLIVCSDHGNSSGRVTYNKGPEKLLKKAGLHVNSRLERPNDVVVPLYGVVNFGVLFVDPELAEIAAWAVIGVEGVNLAAWVSAPETLSVINNEAEAIVRWRDEGGQRFFSYDATRGDPLRLAATVSEMRDLDLLDADGFVSEEDWFAMSAFEEFPDAPRRLVESLTGRYVRNPATVIYSLDPRHAMGTRSAQIGARIVAGHLNGTHGGLDRTSSLGFYLTNDPGRAPAGPAVRVDDVLRELTPYIPLRKIPWD
jgi:hypothetical protein